MATPIQNKIAKEFYKLSYNQLSDEQKFDVNFGVKVHTNLKKTIERMNGK